VRFILAVTDHDWYRHLRGLASSDGLDEVTFWHPSGKAVRHDVGTPWLFKIKGTERIGGFGYYRLSSELPLAAAWDYFGPKCGSPTISSLRAAIARNRVEATTDSTQIAWTVLAETRFWSNEQWISVPPDWKANTQRYKWYDTQSAIGADLWHSVQIAAVSQISLEPHADPGIERLVVSRMHQGEFKTRILRAYDYKCAVTEERAVPVLEAAHIRPFAEVREHDIRNGLLLRSDVHRLFDQGYVTVTRDLRFKVSNALHDDWHNGKEYFRLDGRQIHLPSDRREWPNLEHLEYHATAKFKG